MPRAGIFKQMSDDQAQLRDYLATRDVPCPACGYNLRGLTSGRCPECNLEVVLTVRLAEPRLGTLSRGLWA